MLYPGGRRKALVLSYDDGVTQDRRLVDVLNRHKLKGTFHLNSGLFGTEYRIDASEVRELYAGHEVSVHSVTHPGLANCTRAEVMREIREDRRALEALVGYPVRGMSYPFGSYNDMVIDVLREEGIEYARTVEDTDDFSLPDNPLMWHPTTPHFGSPEYDGMIAARTQASFDQFDAIVERFLQTDDVALLYAWSHSWEFDGEGVDYWARLEDFFTQVAIDTVWSATNIELVDYLNAYRALRFSLEKTAVQNTSARTVWLDVDGRTVEVAPGATVCLNESAEAEA